MTMSIAVLVLETCGALELTVPLMIAIFFAKAVGDLTGTGLYDAYIALKGVPYLPEDEISYEQKMIAEKLDVQEVMTSDLVCLPPLPTVGHVVRILKTYKHNAFPVVEADSEGEGSGLGDEGRRARPGFPSETWSATSSGRRFSACWTRALDSWTKMRRATTWTLRARRRSSGWWRT